MIRALCTALVSLALALPSGSAAQEAHAEDGARALFERGVEELAQGRDDEAIASFRASLSLHPVPATAFNLAIALSDAGRAAEAVEVLRALLAGEHGEVEPERLDQVRAQLTATRGELAMLTVRVSGAASAQLLVDGVEQPLDASGVAHVVRAPGEVLLTARREDGARAEQRVTLSAAEDREVALVLERPSITIAAPPIEPAVADPAPQGTPLEQEPALWIGVGVGALAIAAATVIAVVFGTQSQGDQPLLTAATLSVAW